MAIKAQHSKEYRLFQTLLCTFRKEADLTQCELADALGKTQTFVSQSERGARRVDFTEFVDWAIACRKSPQEALQRYEALAYPDKSNPLIAYPDGPLPYFLLNEGTDAEKLALAKKILELAQSPARPKAAATPAKRKKKTHKPPEAPSRFKINHSKT